MPPTWDGTHLFGCVVFLPRKIQVRIPRRLSGEFKNISSCGLRLQNYHQYTWTTKSVTDSYTAFDED